jgi:predicted alpha/beta hydrolase
VGFARYLATNGFCAFVLDFRGHRLSPPKPAGVNWCFEDWARFDIPAALAEASQAGPARVVTHSAAGAALLTALALQPTLRRKIAALAILATPAPHLAGFGRAAPQLGLAFCQRLGRFPARKLGFGPEDEDGGIMGQWLRWNLRGQWVTQEGLDVLKSLPELDFPVLLVAGQGDWLWSPPPLCRRLWEMLPARTKSFWVLGDAGGGESCPFRPGHVSLVTHPLCRKLFWPRLAAWLAQPQWAT